MIKLPRILRYPNFSRLYWAGLTSEMGSFVTDTAIMLFVFELSGGAKEYLGLSRALFLIFLTIGNILGGPLGEKYNRRNLLIFCNISRVPIVLLLFFFQDLYFVIICNGLIALFTGIYNPSRQTLVNDIIPMKDIKDANSLFGSTLAILHLIGPMAGAALYGYFSGIKEILSFDLLTYFVGIYLLFKMSYKVPKKSDHLEVSFFSDLKEGLSFVKKRKDLLSLIVSVFFLGLCIGILIPLLVPFITEILGGRDRDYGLTLGLFGLGGALGGALSNLLAKHFKTGQIIVVSMALEPFFMLIWLQSSTVMMNALIFLLWGVLVFTRITSQLNYISETVETRYLTRVHSLLDMAFVAPNILGSLVVGLIGNHYSTMQFLYVTAILFFIFIIPRLPFPGMRSLFRSDAKIVERDESIQDHL